MSLRAQRSKPLYAIYIATNTYNTVIYTGVTNNLARRIHEHKRQVGSAFTKRYHIYKLVYYELFEDVREAIAREKQIKGGPRQKKVALINSLNPTWKDLYPQIV